jgi:Protein of unknown function (DUF2950)
MQHRISILVRPGWRTFVRFAAPVLFAILLEASWVPVFAQQPGQRTFASAEQAGYAFFAATQSDNDQALMNILGPEGENVVSSGDPEEDMDARASFIVKYQEMHRFVKEPNGTVTLVVGAENWPLPIPLVNNHGSWYFDTAAGKDEITFRRIGKNEIAAIDACADLVEAEKQYFARTPANTPKQFAQRLVSDQGQHDGLYGDAAYNEADSPFGKDLNQGGDRGPFDGYFFRILTRQGPHAPGGAKNYVVDGKMTAGFAFVAYPAEYHSSGVMTFIVSKSGTIYEKDLGPDTTKIAEAMSAYDPDSTWNKVE